jgi:hypothetical protein
MRSCHRGENPVLGSVSTDGFEYFAPAWSVHLERLFQSGRMVSPAPSPFVADPAGDADGIYVVMGIGFSPAKLASSASLLKNDQAQAAAEARAPL